MTMRRREFASLVYSPVAALVILWMAYTCWFFVGDNYRLALNPVNIPAYAWQIVHGGGQVDLEEIRLERPGRYGQAMAAAGLDPAIPVGDIARLRVFVKQVGDAFETKVGLSSTASFARTVEAPLTLNGEGWSNVSSAELGATFGEVRFLLIRARGSLRMPLIVERVEIDRKRPQLLRMQLLLLKSLINLDPWTQRSINHAQMDYAPLRVSPVVAAFMWVMLSLIIFVTVGYRGLSRRRLVSFALAMIVAGWLVLDISWQTTLFGRHLKAVERFGGESPESKRLAGSDSEVFLFIHKLKELLDDSRQSLVIFGDTDFTHYRARYFAIPQLVASHKGVNWRWLRWMQPEMVLVLLHTKGAVYEAGLNWQRYEDRDSTNVKFAPLEVAGRSASLMREAYNSMGGVLRLKDDGRPWLVRSGWLDQGPGLWRLSVNVAVTDQDGWVRVEVFRRGSYNERQRLAWRQVYLRAGEPFKGVSLPFQIGEDEQFRFRVREVNARGLTAKGVRLQTLTVEPGMVALSRDGNPPYWLARKLLETEIGVAYELM